MEAIGAIAEITGITVRVSSKLWALRAAWRDAPADLHRLCDDLVRVQQFLGETENGLRESYAASPESPPSGSQRELQKLLNQGTRVVEEIEHIIDKLHRGDGSGLGQFENMGKRRKAIWLRDMSKVTRLRKELKTLTFGICHLLMAQNTVVLAELRTSVSRSQEAITSHIVRATEAISESTNQSIRDARDEMLTSVNHALAISRQSLISKLDSRLETLQVSMSMETRRRLDTQAQHQQATTTAIGHVRDSTAPLPPFLPRYAASILRPASACSPLDCECQCHSRTDLSKWHASFSSGVIGHIFLTYSALSSRPCTISTCRRGAETRQALLRNVTAFCRFPSWLVRAAISVHFSSGINGSPEMVIRLVNTVSLARGGPLNIFHYISFRNVGGIKRLFQERRASIYDVLGSFRNLSPLHLAVWERVSTVVAFLLQVGADPFQVTTVHGLAFTAAGAAFELSLSDDATAPDGVSRLLPGVAARYVEEMDPPALHRAVLGVDGLTVDDIPSLLRRPCHRADLDTCFLAGLSPLHMAAIKGDLPALTTLLRAGADVQVQTAFDARTPLHLACEHNRYDAARLLLREGGAHVNARDKQSFSPALLAVMLGASARLLDLLARHGADLREPDPGGWPLLYTACGGNSPHRRETIRYLVKQVGLDMEWSGGSDGDTALFQALCHRSADAAMELVELGANVRHVNKCGENILHYVARYPVLELIRYFTDLKMRGVSATARDETGKTPLQILLERNEPVEVQEAFHALLDSIVEEHEASDDDGDDDEFHDARERSDDS